MLLWIFVIINFNWGNHLLLRNSQETNRGNMKESPRWAIAGIFAIAKLEDKEKVLSKLRIWIISLETNTQETSLGEAAWWHLIQAPRWPIQPEPLFDSDVQKCASQSQYLFDAATNSRWGGIEESIMVNHYGQNVNGLCKFQLTSRYLRPYFLTACQRIRIPKPKFIHPFLCRLFTFGPGGFRQSKAIPKL